VTRGAVRGLDMPYPLWTLLPAVLQEDEFTVRFTAGLDDVLAPAVSALDCLPAYLDPDTAPADFLAWLAGWFDLTLAEDLPPARRRAAVAAAVPLSQVRGTPEGLRRQLELATGAEVEVTDSGGVGVGRTPGSALPGSDVPTVTVRVTLPAGAAALDERLLHELITAGKPAHVAHRLEVFQR
jgi:phage tail-like protein